jgi:hypothetical protein
MRRSSSDLARNSLTVRIFAGVLDGALLLMQWGEAQLGIGGSGPRRIAIQSPDVRTAIRGVPEGALTGGK